MTKRRRDPFPKQGRYRQRYERTPVDPLEVELARRAAEEAEIREQVANGYTPQADPEDLRGIPVQAKGVGGTSPGTDPLSQAVLSDHRLSRA